MAGDLTRRVAVAAVGIPLGIWIIYLGGWVLAGVLGLVAALGAREFYLLAEARGVRPLDVPGITVAVALVVLAGVRPTFVELAPWAFGLLFFLTLFCLAAVIWMRWPGGAPLGAVSSTVAGALYTGGALAFALLIRNLPDTAASGAPATAWAGAALLIFPLLVTWIGDSCAYFAGSAWGRRKLLPTVSPGKTMVGGVAGLVGAMAAGGVYAGLVLAGQHAYAVSALLGTGMGLVIGVAAQVGDLAESVLKREAGRKDSGEILPGHGGALDRFDAIFFTVPLTYVMLVAAEALL